MAASRIPGIMTDSFLDGITGAALFGKLRRPGAPTVLVDTQAPEEAFLEYGPVLDAKIVAMFPRLNEIRRSREQAPAKPRTV